MKKTGLYVLGDDYLKYQKAFGNKKTYQNRDYRINAENRGKRPHIKINVTGIDYYAPLVLSYNREYLPKNPIQMMPESDNELYLAPPINNLLIEPINGSANGAIIFGRMLPVKKDNIVTEMGLGDFGFKNVGFVRRQSEYINDNAGRLLEKANELHAIEDSGNLPAKLIKSVNHFKKMEIVASRFNPNFLKDREMRRHLWLMEEARVREELDTEMRDAIDVAVREFER
jgi:hypothetical protein